MQTPLKYHCILICYLMLVFSAHAEKHKTWNVVFVPYFGSIPLTLESDVINAAGDTLTISLFQFYISNLKLSPKDISPAAHLFRADDTSTWKIELPTENNLIRSITFDIGVDSVANTSGANEGDLDPIKGMYWAWNSGYIMAKLEGNCRVCSTVHHAFEFHIGGYQSPNKTLRSISLSSKDPIIKSKAPDHCFVIKVDVCEWFNGLNLSTTPTVLIPGAEACRMADRYSRMFSLITTE